MKEYYALIDEKGQISEVKVSFIPLSYSRKSAEKIKRMGDLDLMVETGKAVYIKKREARIYSRLLNERKELTARLEKIALELGVK